MIKKDFIVLYIEEDTRNTSLLIECLEALGKQINYHMVKNLGEGIDWLHKNRADVILLDLKYPSGAFDPLKKLLATHPQSCLVLLTREDDMQTGAQSLKLGAQDFILKNEVTPALMLKTLSYAYERHHLNQQVRQREQELKEITNTVKNAIFKVKVEGPNLYRYVMVNDMFCSRVGKTQDQIVGQLIDQVLPEDGRERSYKEYDRAITQKATVSWKMKMGFLTGTKWGLVTITPHFNRSGQCEYIIGSVSDLTIIKKNHEELKEREEFLNTLLDNSLNAVLVADDQGNYLQVNKEATRLFGYSKEEFLSMKVDDLMNTGIVNGSEVYSDFLRKKAQTGEFQFYDKHGNKKIAVYKAKRVRPDLNVSVLIDITDNLVQQETIKRLSMIATKTVNGGIITDKAGKIIWVNQAFEKYTGFQLNEVINKKPGDFLQGPDTDPKVIRQMAEGLHRQEGFQVEVLNYTKSKEPIWFQMNCQPIFTSNGDLEGFFALQTDITKNKLYQLKLKENRNRLDLAIKCANLGILDLDLVTKKANVEGAYFKITGYSPEEFVPGRKDFESKLLHPADRKYVLSILDKIESGEIKTCNENYRIITKSGAIKWLNIQGESMFTREIPTRFIAIIRDITQSVINEETLLKASISGQEKERERISLEIHDGLQQTIVSAYLTLQSVKKHVSFVDEKYMDRCEKLAATLNESIGECRNIAHQLMPRALNRFGLSASIKSLINDYSDKLSIEFTDLESAYRFEQGIELALYRITQEALTNIMKHSNARTVKISLLESEHNLILEISDNGNGFNVEENKQNFGLLSMLNRAKAVGGGLNITSHMGIGTRIVVSVPMETVSSDLL